MIRITSSHGERLARMAPAPIVQAISSQVEINADLIVRDAQQSILDGSGGGRRSSPGDAPNNQTGALIASGFSTPAIHIGDEIRASAGFGAEYGGYLEHGTSRMAPRPFLVPATERQRGTTFRGILYRFREIVGLR